MGNDHCGARQNPASAAEDEAFTRALGERVRLRRLALRLSQLRLGLAAGVSRPFLSLVERGAHAPNILTLRRIAVALNVPLAELLDEAAGKPASAVAVRDAP